MFPRLKNSPAHVFNHEQKTIRTLVDASKTDIGPWGQNLVLSRLLASIMTHNPAAKNVLISPYGPVSLDTVESLLMESVNGCNGFYTKVGDLQRAALVQEDIKNIFSAIKHWLPEDYRHHTQALALSGMARALIESIESRSGKTETAVLNHTNPFLTLRIANEILFDVCSTSRITPDKDFPDTALIREYYGWDTPTHGIYACHLNVACAALSKFSSFLEQTMIDIQVGGFNLPVREEDVLTLTILHKLVSPYETRMHNFALSKDGATQRRSTHYEPWTPDMI